VVTRALSVRARVAARPEPRYERLYDATLDDLVRRGPLSRERFATHWADTAALTKLGESKRAPLPAALARELTEYHRRLGASAASLANLDRLTRGEAVATVAGQQPAPLGGPLFSAHKVASAAALATTYARRTRLACVPLFWMHGEDSDFAEIRGASIIDDTLAMRDFALPANAHHDGALVGGIGLAPLEALEAEALAAWAQHPAADDAARLLTRARANARDLGEANAALQLALFAEQGLVVVDPRLPAFREAARVVIERYLANADALSAAARTAGERLERAGGRRALNDASLDSFVFAIEDGTRRKIGAADAKAGTHLLSPSVALRPAVQDGVFPTVAMACGPGEVAYLLQLREVFEGVGVLPACPAARFSATWLPPAAVELIEATGADPWDVVCGADAVLRAHADAAVPPAVRAALETAQRAALDGLTRFSDTAKQVDASLPQMVESARGKVDFQFQRLLEGLTGKVRHQIERRHPEWLRLRYVLLPGDRLQERRLAGMEPVAWRGAALASEMTRLAGEQAEALERGTLEHFLVDL